MINGASDGLPSLPRRMQKGWGVEIHFAPNLSEIG
jgi:hypothetical protein